MSNACRIDIGKRSQQISEMCSNYVVTRSSYIRFDTNSNDARWVSDRCSLQISSNPHSNFERHPYQYLSNDCRTSDGSFAQLSSTYPTPPCASRAPLCHKHPATHQTPYKHISCKKWPQRPKKTSMRFLVCDGVTHRINTYIYSSARRCGQATPSSRSI